MAYRFNDRACIIQIEDCKFRIAIGKDMDGKMRRSRDIIEEMRAEKDRYSDEAEACTAVDKAIDSLLGEGAAARIFEGREVSLFERFDVIIYIYGEITKFANKVTGELNVSPKVSGN